MTADDLDVVLLLGAAVVLVSVVAVRAATKAGLPGLLIYLGLGLLIGEDGLGLQFDDAQVAQALGLSALAVILVEGGLTTSWPAIRRSIAPSAVLATLGVFVSVLVVAAGSVLLVGVDWRVGLLLGAVVSPTDAAAVFSVLRSLPLPTRVSGLLESESGFNDAPSVILVVLLSTHGLGNLDPLVALATVVYELAVGIAVGLALGLGGGTLLRRLALPASGLYPIAAYGFGVAAYGLAGVAQGSGFLAAYLAALVLGNSRMPHRPAIRSFAEGLGWLAQIGLFVMLGLLASPSRLPGVLLPALGVGLVLLLVARPLSVLVSLAPFRFPVREQAFLSWAGLRGAVPIVLATIPVVEGVADSERLFDVVFVIVTVFTLVQGPSLPYVARRLGVTVSGETREVDIESAPLETIHADLLQLTVPRASRLHGVEVFELRLPPGAVVTLVVRRGAGFVPDRYTRLERGDELLIVTTPRVRSRVEQRMRAVSRGGRLAGWYGDVGDPRDG